MDGVIEVHAKDCPCRDCRITRAVNTKIKDLAETIKKLWRPNNFN
jgi:hypothetical protein